MPWLAVPFEDASIKHLNAKFKVTSVPKLVIVGQDGKVATDDGIKKLGTYGRLRKTYPILFGSSLDLGT